jgi:hypothetical protein
MSEGGVNERGEGGMHERGMSESINASMRGSDATDFGDTSGYGGGYGGGYSDKSSYGGGGGGVGGESFGQSLSGDVGQAGSNGYTGHAEYHGTSGAINRLCY